MRIDASSSTTKIELGVDKMFGLRVLNHSARARSATCSKTLDEPWLDDPGQQTSAGAFHAVT